MSRSPDTSGTRKCSFCGKSEDQVRKLIVGANVYICDQCIELCNDIIEAEWEEERSRESRRLADPAEIETALDQYLLGQERAKSVLALAVHSHYERIAAASGTDGGEIQKANILLIGPTGSGKTLLAQAMAKTLRVPFTIADATTLVEVGDVGEDVETIVLRLLQAADYDVERAQRGIVYIDEIDKIARRGGRPAVARDAQEEGIQQALVRLLGSTTAGVSPQGKRACAHQELIQVDTTNVLFICGAVFAGTEKRVAEPEDLLAHGLIPELVRRLPVIARLDGLAEAALGEILREPKNAIMRKYQKRFDLVGRPCCLHGGDPWCCRTQGFAHT